MGAFHTAVSPRSVLVMSSFATKPCIDYFAEARMRQTLEWPPNVVGRLGEANPAQNEASCVSPTQMYK